MATARGVRALLGNAQGWMTALRMGEGRNVLKGCSTFATFSGRHEFCPPLAAAVPTPVNAYANLWGRKKFGILLLYFVVFC